MLRKPEKTELVAIMYSFFASDSKVIILLILLQRSAVLAVAIKVIEIIYTFLKFELSALILLVVTKRI